MGEQTKPYKSILKDNTLKVPQISNQGQQSNSIGAVRWVLPDEEVQVHSSAPTIPYKSNSGFSTRSQQRQRQQGLKDLRSLDECIQFINRWKQQVAQVCKNEDDPGEGSSRPTKTDSRTERSLEESRKLILQWANELQSVDKSCGMPGDELAQMLRLLGLRKKRLATLMPLLEFITWSLLKEESKGMVPHLWLSAKQRTWKAGISRYIPNSVWSWIVSAGADVSLDPMTNNPWLYVSEDHKKIQEGLIEANLPYSSQRFDSLPCVLGWEGYMSGRHYWEVEFANNGYWRVGVTTASSKRHGRFPMNPSSGYWVLWRSTRQFFACTNPETPLPQELVPRRMGIYIDYEEGQISFYNADNKSHIYTFTGHFREKLYPFFSLMDGRTLMTLWSPKEHSHF
nr:E3 ubiquitin-protein ligase TRIM39-like isoform X2 [Danio rerio]XP_021335988.1 E3 ubiquitin-protein ligase TRIM39-like isoform X2 [Danio rerio]|eukprot:XP_021328207.1 E3 ubiquitin-protein ligase TRIM39-like isoform X2 [Danio rerio]